MTRLTTLLVIALLSTTGCKKKAEPKPAPGSASGSAATMTGSGSSEVGSNAMPDPGSAAGSGSAMAGSGPDTPVASGSGSGSGSAAPTQRGVGAVVEGTSCDGHGEQITKAGATSFKLTGKVLAGQHGHGCGCPTKPVHTLVYKKASPLEVRVCFDPKADMCEAACRDVKFDVGAALDAAKATDVKFVD